MFHIGIDPGKTGALVLLSSKDLKFIDAKVMPSDVHELAAIILKWKKYDIAMHAWIEKAQTMPKQGIVSAFNYGKHFGEILAIMALLEIPYTLVSPARWTKALHMSAGATSGSKAKSLLVAKRLYPGFSFLATERSKVAHKGIVDALLIARFGLQYGGSF